MHRITRTRRGFAGLLLAFAVVVSGAVVTAAPAEAASSSNKVTFSKVTAKTAAYKGKVTVKPNVKKSGKVSISKKTLTVKQGSRTIAKDKTSVKLGAGTYTVTQKVAYRTYAIKTTKKQVKKKVVGVPAYSDVAVTCTATRVWLDQESAESEVWGAEVDAACTSTKFDGRRTVSVYLYDFGDEWWGFDDDTWDDLTVAVLPEVGVPFSAVLSPSDDLMKTKLVTTTTSIKVYSKTKTATSKAQTLVVKQKKKPSWVYGSGGYSCPSGYPIKGNASSMIYHVPGGAYYSRTKPEQCFATESAARAEGYRKAKR